MDNSEPLWKKMHRAHMEHADPLAACALRGYAAEIRAIADWLVPERDAPPSSPHMGGYVEHVLWAQTQMLRDLLLDEANRAEAGE